MEKAATLHAALISAEHRFLPASSSPNSCRASPFSPTVTALLPAALSVVALGEGEERGKGRENEERGDGEKEEEEDRPGGRGQ